MQGYTFVHDVYMLDLEPYNLILGVDWMKVYGPLTFDFKELKIVFDLDEEQVVLYWKNHNTAVFMSKKGLKPCWSRNKRKRMLKQSSTVSFNIIQVTEMQDSLTNCF